MSLTDAAVRTAKPKEKNYKLSDEKGLYLEVAKTGSKYWRLKFRFAGKENRLALGVYPEVSLKDARQKVHEARQDLDRGINPSAKRRAQKMAVFTSSGNTFELIAHEWFEARMADKSESHRVRTSRIVQNDLLPLLGNRPISEISAPELLAVLRKIENRDALETARRAHQLTTQIFRYAIVTGRADRDPSIDLRGALKQPKKTHFAAITAPKEVAELMRAIDLFNGTAIVSAALKLSAYLFQRPGEIRHMQWSQIDFEACEWRYLVTKTQTDHIVPLSTQAMVILQELRPVSGRSPYVLPSARGASRPMSNNAVRIALRSMGFDKETITAHGFRAMARTILDEVLGFRVDWIEHQLAHSVRDANGRAYNRTAHLEGRKKMMQEWADYLDKLKA